MSSESEIENMREKLYEELFLAYTESRKGKRKTHDEHRFELNDYYMLREIRDALWDKSYKPSRSTVHIVHKPVKREIFAACFVDRVVHRWIYDNIAPWWDRHFINDSYSCRVEKGTLYGIMRLDKFIKKCSKNYTKKTYVIKMDIQGYFMSIPRELLYRRVIEGLNRQFEGENFSWRYYVLENAIREIIFDDPTDGAIRKERPGDRDDLPDSKTLYGKPKGVGIVIGNLTSQLFSNILLDALDKFVVYELGYKYYGRYVDDFFIVVDEENLGKAKKDIEKIRDFLREMGLTLHPRKTKIQSIDKGVDFLGVVIYPRRIVIGKRLKKNIGEALFRLRERGEIVETVQVYLGLIEHYNGARTVRKMMRRYGYLV